MFDGVVLSFNEISTIEIIVFFKFFDTKLKILTP